MDVEYDALIKNKTWHHVPQKGRNIIDCKWVYKIKRKVDGSLDTKLVLPVFYRHAHRGIPPRW
jgi:hypothetical protein